MQAHRRGAARSGEPERLDLGDDEAELVGHRGADRLAPRSAEVEVRRRAVPVPHRRHRVGREAPQHRDHHRGREHHRRRGRRRVVGVERDTGPHDERERRAGDHARDLPRAGPAARSPSTAPTRRIVRCEIDVDGLAYPDHDPRITTSYGRRRGDRELHPDDEEVGDDERHADQDEDPHATEHQQPDHDDDA